MSFEGNSWFQVGFYCARLVFIGQGRFFVVPRQFFIVPGRFSWFFKIPGWFFMVSGGFSCFQVVFHGFFMLPGLVFMIPSFMVPGWFKSELSAGGAKCSV